VGKVVGEAKLSKKYQVTIPKTVRVLLGLGPEDKIKFILEGEKIYIEKA